MSQRIEQITQLLKDEPEDAFLNYALAMEYIGAGWQIKALEQLEHLLRLHPDYLGTYYQLGQLYERTEQKEKAIDAYEKGMTLAKRQGNNKTWGELNTAYQLMD
jgi:Tfp pilus assembly protein PilF